MCTRESVLHTCMHGEALNKEARQSGQGWFHKINSVFLLVFSILLLTDKMFS